MNDRAGRIGAGALFASGGALAAYAVWAFAQVDRVIREARDAGQLAEGAEFDVAAYYMSGSGLYLVCAVGLAALGWVLLRTAPVHQVIAPSMAQPIVARRESHDELDDLFESTP